VTVYVTPGPRPLAMVRNPLLALPTFRSLQALPTHCRHCGGQPRDLLRQLLLELRRDCFARAEHSWLTHKPGMAVYWKVIGVLAGHTARALR